MAGKRTKNLTEETRQAIRAMRRDNPRMTYKEIGKVFGVGSACVCTTVNGQKYTAGPPKPQVRVPVIFRESRCTIQQPDSIIRPIPKERLMAGNGRYARPVA